MSEKQKNVDLEFLRAAAILMILVQHGGLMVFKPGEAYAFMQHYFNFWGGVDLFFCISGFIITRGLIESHPATDNRYVMAREGGWRQTAFPFWMRRAWRLWPSAWLWIALPTGCAVLLNSSGIFGSPERMLGGGAAALVHLANLYWAGCYAGDGSACNFVTSPHVPTVIPTGWALAPYWSLSLEEQFYLLAPLLLFFLPKRRIALAIALAFLALVPLLRSPLGVAWFFRIDALLVGVSLGWASTRQGGQWFARTPAWLRYRWLACGVALALLIAIGALGHARFASTRGIVTLMALCSGGLVWLAGHDRNLLLPAGSLAGRVLLWIGARSYCLYLCHMTAILLAIELGYRADVLHSPHWWWISTLTAAALMALFAEATARWVEMPLRRRGRLYAARWLAGQAPPQGSAPP